MCYFIKKKIPYYHDEGILWKELYQYVRENHIEILKQNNNNIAIYYDEEHKEGQVEIQFVVSFILRRSLLVVFPVLHLPLIQPLWMKFVYSFRKLR